MPVGGHGGVEVGVEEEGVVGGPEGWREVGGMGRATTEGVDEMTDDHWAIADYLRNYYLEYGVAPMIRKLCKETGFKLKEIYALYPSGPAKGACKVAGLPKPTGCV